MNKNLIRFSTLLLAAAFLFTYCQNPPEETASEEATTVEAEDDMTAAAETEDDMASAAMEQSPIEQGEELYISYCGICHGDDAKGEGAMANMLKIPPSDLTTITSRYGGTFPEEEMHEIIRGGQEVPGHGQGDMPVWGKTFFDSEGLSTQEQVDEKIDYLVAYLESIQE